MSDELFIDRLRTFFYPDIFGDFELEQIKEIIRDMVDIDDQTRINQQLDFLHQHLNINTFVEEIYRDCYYDIYHKETQSRPEKNRLNIEITGAGDGDDCTRIRYFYANPTNNTRSSATVAHK